jgi:hypothetical protein
VHREFNSRAYRLRYVALEVAYLGTKYHGFASQADTCETVEVRLRLATCTGGVKLSLGECSGWCLARICSAVSHLCFTSVTIVAEPLICSASESEAGARGLRLEKPALLALRSYGQGRERSGTGEPRIRLPRKACRMLGGYLLGDLLQWKLSSCQNSE